MTHVVPGQNTGEDDGRDDRVRPPARFHWVCGVLLAGRSAPAWLGAGQPGGVGDDGDWVSWRLLGGNNRELGRAARTFPDAEACLAHLLVVRSRLGDLVPMVGTGPHSGHWSWRLELERERVAVSGRGYQRQRECRYNLAQFVAALPEALAPEDPPSPAPSVRLVRQRHRVAVAR